MAKLSSFDKQNGKLISVTFTLDSKQELGIIAPLVKEGFQKWEGICPECGNEIDLKSKIYVKIYSPLSDGGILGFTTGDVFATCGSCKKDLVFATIDISPFKSITDALNVLKAKYSKKGSGANGKKK